MINTDNLEDFIEFDATLGADIVKCPKCGKIISSSLLFDDEIECPDCGQRIKKS